MSNKWCTIESDPGVFTELVQKIGVKGVQFEELFVLDDETMNQIKPIHGLIFLFKWVSNPEKRDTIQYYDPTLFFAQQVINNACATQAILSILMNQSDKIDIGPELQGLKDFTMGMSKRDKGEAIGNSELIRQVHNSFARQDPFTIEEEDDKGGKEDDDVFHFISYVPYKGVLYELDGCQPGPISFGECNDDDWLSKARVEIQKRIDKYSQSEIRFNLLAIIDDKKEKANSQIERLIQLEKFLKHKLNLIDSISEEEENFIKQKYEAELNEIWLNKTQEEVSQSLNEKINELENQKQILAQETERQNNWKQENERRRHNYVPLIFELLQQLAKKNMLKDLFEDAKNQKKKKIEENKNKKDIEMKD